MKNEKRKKLKKIFFQLAFILFLTVLVAANLMAGTITIVSDKWAPYNGDPDSSTPGYGIEIVKRVFEAEGYTVKYLILPWARAVKATRAGKYNAVIGAYKENAPDFIYPEEKMGLSKNAFFVKRGNPWRFHGVGSLQTVTIGLVKDYNYGEGVDAFFKANQERVQYFYGEKALLTIMRSLNNKIIDVAIEDENVFLYKTRELNLTGQYTNAGYSTKSGIDVYIAFSPKIQESKKHAEIFSKGIRELKQSGELKKILAKYELKYWQ